jgi:hypothetical protein
MSLNLKKVFEKWNDAGILVEGSTHCYPENGVDEGHRKDYTKAKEREV